MQAKIVPWLLPVLIATGLLLLVDGRWPEAWNPWAPLRLEQTPNLLTPYKIGRMAAEPAACRALLERAPMRFTPLADRETAPGCGFDNALRVTATRFAVGAPLTLSCPVALSLALWERHGVEPAALRHFGSPVVRLEHLGSYACRDVAGRPGRRSRHASADAIDIAGLVLADGRRISVARDWSGDDAASRFLRELRDAGCGVFDAVLSPDYNAAHADHLHLERGPYRACR